MPNLPPLTQATPTPPHEPITAEEYARRIRELGDTLLRDLTWERAPSATPPPPPTTEALNRVLRQVYGRAPESRPVRVYCTPPCRKNCKCGRTKGK